MKTVLIFNHYQYACGVQQFGVRIWELVKSSTNVNYVYREVEDYKTYNSYINEINPDVIVYNWNRGTMTWLTDKMLIDRPHIKHYFIFHDEFTRNIYDKYLFFGDYDFSGGTRFGDKKVLLPRPLLQYEGAYPTNDTITIGSFGFGFWNKGYHRLTRMVNENFNDAILNFHIPYSYYGDLTDAVTKKVIAECERLNTNPTVKLNITREFKSTEKVLEFLAGNDINVFLYDENGEGISSVIDYALSVRRPIAISNSKMFRHIASNDILVTPENSILDVLKRGTSPLKKFYREWNIVNFQTEMDKVFDDN